MSAINGGSHAFKSYGLQIGSMQFASLKSIEHSPSQSLEYTYGTGAEPQDLVATNRTYTGTVTIERRELTNLLNSMGVNTMLDLPPVALIEKSENGQGQLVTYSYIQTMFENEGHAINQNDADSPVKLPFKALGMKRA
jgi:hypothetical protein